MSAASADKVRLENVGQWTFGFAIVPISTTVAMLLLIRAVTGFNWLYRFIAIPAGALLITIELLLFSRRLRADYEIWYGRLRSVSQDHEEGRFAGMFLFCAILSALVGMAVLFAFGSELFGDPVFPTRR